MPSITMDGLGSAFNVFSNIFNAEVYMHHGEALTVVQYTPTGIQTITLTESISGESDQDLEIIDTIWSAPGDGSGTWTKVTQAAANTYTHADATNDMTAVTIRSDQLSAGFNNVKVVVTPATGTRLHVGIVTGLYIARDPSLLPLMRI